MEQTFFRRTNVIYEHAHSGDAPPSQKFSVPFQFMHACVCSPQVKMKRQRSLSSYFLQEECTQTSQEDVVRDSHDFEASSTTSATPPCTEAPSDDAMSTSMSSKVSTSSSSDLMGSSPSKSPRIDWKPSWKDRYT